MNFILTPWLAGGTRTLVKCAFLLRKDASWHNLRLGHFNIGFCAKDNITELNLFLFYIMLPPIIFSLWKLELSGQSKFTDLLQCCFNQNIIYGWSPSGLDRNRSDAANHIFASWPWGPAIDGWQHLTQNDIQVCFGTRPCALDRSSMWWGWHFVKRLMKFK